ncbi:ABC transporter, permease protein [Hungatella hathewayi DSM 13479]|jgi:multiple sugar transport system permease protein|uniref:ABC transporter, permease protein n=2 Tax=Hungatella hathewayi TaxID=154046 RepID=D3AQL1_9FIRM|nr:ABC transporter, permease protein [Hungatella hathewayi DSM 13479]
MVFMKRKSITGNKKAGLMGWLLNGPYLIYSLIFFLIPLIWAFWLSTMDWNLMSEQKTFVGIRNFAGLFADSRVKAAFINSYRYLLPIVVLCFAGGLIIALLVSNLPDKIKGLVAVLFFIPYLTSGVATSVVVKYFFNYNSAFNTFLRDQFNLNINWLTDQRYAFAVMVGIVVWKMSGYYALFILSGIESIGDDVTEAAMLDGSTGLHKLLHITLPMIMPTLTTVIVLATGLAFGVFTEPYLLTGGGPNMTTTTWQLEIYNTSFTRFQSGYGAAMAIASAVQIFITLRIINAVTDRLNRRFGW